ncbi:leucine-rich repeat extensin-like protein 7 [Elaeis guineensis]|uniref:Cell wall hydroxyproline-rich glycoprotein n=1 Tax=Elaeis guineensis var. tenera TaxID=51953 RepID=A0A6I9R7Q9_ELAGV|nr:pollen-specific leucine-rich repeat extensin-like protein 3 [Elaeis guineensis]
MALPRPDMEAFGCSTLLPLLFLLLSPPLLALSDAQAASIARRQLLTFHGNSFDFLNDFEFDISINVDIRNPRLKLAYNALQAWKKAIFSDPTNFTSNWVGHDVCAYNGIFCAPSLDDPSIQVVAGVDFNGADLAGFIPIEIGLLNDTAFLHVNSNRFCGVLPSSLSSLTLLHELDVSNNRLVGPFPSVVLDLSALKYLDLRFNNFEGPLPPKLFDKDLDALFLNDNRFASNIPENLGNSTVSVLVLANNKFEGSIPKTIGRMKSTLNEIILSNNGFTGCLPDEIGSLSELTVLDASFNSFSGVLPETLASLRKLESLNIAHNMLTGIVPGSVCGIKSLGNFKLSDNYFKGAASECTSRSDLVFDDKGNCFLERGQQKSRKACAPVQDQPIICHHADGTKCDIDMTPPPVYSPPPPRLYSRPTPLPSPIFSPPPPVHSPPPPNAVVSPPDPYNILPPVRGFNYASPPPPQYPGYN